MSAEPATVDAAAFLKMGKDVLARQPFSTLLGAELLSLVPGVCEARATAAGSPAMETDR